MLTIWDLVNLELLQKIVLSKLVILIKTIAIKINRDKSYVTKRVSQEKLVFSISNQNFDLNFGYKNLEVNSQNLLFDGNTNEKHQLIDRESFRDGKSSRSETSTNDRRSNGSLQSEPAFAGGLRGRKLSTIRDRGNRNKDQLEESAKKKPEFLSD